MASAHALGAWGCEFESRVSDHHFISLDRLKYFWRYRLVVRTTGFHPVNRSSILRSAAIIISSENKKDLLYEVLFVFIF